MNGINSDGSRHLLAPLATIPTCQRSNEESGWFPLVDILEDAQEYLFKIDLPEVSAEDLHVFIEGQELVITGERPPPAPEDKHCLRIERPHGHFERRFALPDDASRVEIEPLYRECVLELHVHKRNPGVVNPAPANQAPKLKLRATA